MEFFNKKEEVLDFQLTEHGKNLLQQGNLKPTYYAFFDDDILYDPAAGGVSEKQNTADRRIKYETPALKVQPFTLGAETRVNEYLGDIQLALPVQTLVSENSVAFVDTFQESPQFAQKHFLGADPLGTSDLKTQYAPAWHINCLANEISSSENFYTVNITASNVGLRSGMVRHIPQLNIDIDYKNFFSSEDELLGAESQNILKLGEFISDSNVGLYVQENYLVLEIQEENTDFLKENFDVEVFHSGSDGTLTRLEFPREENILQDPVGATAVDQYMNLRVDAEIPGTVIAALGLEQRILGGSSVKVRLTRDLYQTDNEEPC